MKLSLSVINKYIVNSLYLTIVFVVVFFVATQALVRKINTYTLTESLLFLEVDKPDVSISNTIPGRVDEVLVKSGDHVEAGDVLMRLSDESAETRIEVLRSLARENLSANTELQLLRARSEEYEIKATRAGVIYEILVTKGSFLQSGTTVVNLFADDEIRLIGSIRPDQYPLIEKNRDISVFSTRLGQAYTVLFQGVGKVKEEAPFINAEGTEVLQEEKYEISFILKNQEQGTAFIEGERLEVIPANREEERVKPLNRLVSIWNSLILGVDPALLLERTENNK
ncbi:MAG: biotin/lipoyl-binding protein [Candidatus Moranbacteria bacterium]|nr:biotin/lipoyl-binding protein [Candidatus Moranbacteria bacterium]